MDQPQEKHTHNSYMRIISPGSLSPPQLLITYRHIWKMQRFFSASLVIHRSQTLLDS